MRIPQERREDNPIANAIIDVAEAIRQHGRMSDEDRHLLAQSAQRPQRIARRLKILAAALAKLDKQTTPA